MITLNVNDESHQLDVSPEMPLLWAIRDKLNLTGTKFGCGHAMCGACVVHLDGEAARSCSIMVGEAAGKRDYHHRGHFGPGGRSGNPCLEKPRRGAVRLLSIGADYVGHRAAE